MICSPPSPDAYTLGGEPVLDTAKRSASASARRIHPGMREAAELCQCGIEEWPGALGVTRLAAARIHEGLVVVHDGALRACALLVERHACPRKPIGRFAVASLQRVDPGEGELGLSHGPPEVYRDH